MGLDQYRENLLGTLPLHELRRVLILRTAQWPLMDNLFEIVKQIPTLQTTLLLQKTEKENIFDAPFRVLEIQSGPLSFRRIGRSVRKTCKASEFDAVLIPLSRDSLEGYENVFSIIPFLTKAPAYAVTRNGEIHDVTKRYLLGLYGALLSQVFKMIFYPLGIILMFIVLGILFVFFRVLRCFRKFIR